MAGLVGGLKNSENFLKCAKKLHNKLQKCIILAYFSKKFQKPAFNFRVFGRKTLLVGKFLGKL